MEPTPRFWRVSALAAFLAAFAVLVGRPLLLLGSAGIVTLVLLRQWAFLADTAAVDESLSVDIDLPGAAVQQNETRTVTLAVTLSEPAPIETTVTLQTPLTVTGDESLTAVVPAGEQHVRASGELTWPSAGAVTFEQPAVTVASHDGLFTQTVRRGPAPSLVVEPRVPRTVHVGEGGDRRNAAFGTHRTGEFGQGLDPVELREYTPGDDIGNIDWNATARHGDVYVREYEVESDRQTVLLFDHRESTALGQSGEQVCDYLREVALGLVDMAEAFGDPVGLYTVGDGGLTAEFAPSIDAEQYRTVRSELHELEPTAETDSLAVQSGPLSDRSPPHHQADAIGARSKATRLDPTESQFAAQLQPFFADAQQYVRRLEGRPLFDVARTYAESIGSDSLTVICTTDADPSQVRETVKVARGTSGHVVVLLAPRVLFEDTAMTGLEATYDRYTEFERFRRDLANMDRVSAYEVAPGDRLDAVLAAGQNRPR